MLWLMEKNILNDLLQAKSDLIPEAEDRQAHAIKINSRSILSKKNNIAQINIQGVLTDSPDIISELFGGGNTTYSEILEDLSIANFDDDVDSIILDIDSPGGEATASWVAVMNAIADSKKPVTAVIGTMAASAAYGIASQANKIYAQNEMSSVGSIGVVASFVKDKELIEITSREAPNKRPDVTSSEGKSVVQDQLDDIHNIFAKKVASGRNKSVEEVNIKFGKGGLMLANNAIQVGMIDGFLTNSSNKHKEKENNDMDLNKLKSEYSDIYNAVIAIERDRVMAHLTLGQESGDLKTAVKAIEEGSDLTQSIKAIYLAASMKKQDIDARASDTIDVNESIENPVNKNEEADIKVIDLVFEKLGIDRKEAK